MYRAARTRARPPKTVRVPRRVPLSRLKGAAPNSAGDLTGVQGAQLRQLVGAPGRPYSARKRRSIPASSAGLW